MPKVSEKLLQGLREYMEDEVPDLVVRHFRINMWEELYSTTAVVVTFAHLYFLEDLLLCT